MVSANQDYREVWVLLRLIASFVLISCLVLRDILSTVHVMLFSKGNFLTVQSCLLQILQEKS